MRLLPEAVEELQAAAKFYEAEQSLPSVTVGEGQASGERARSHMAVALCVRRQPGARWTSG